MINAELSGVVSLLYTRFYTRFCAHFGVSRVIGSPIFDANPLTESHLHMSGINAKLTKKQQRCAKAIFCIHQELWLKLLSSAFLRNLTRKLCFPEIALAAPFKNTTFWRRRWDKKSTIWFEDRGDPPLLVKQRHCVWKSLWRNATAALL